MSSRDKALIALHAALDKKALEPALLDLSEQHSYTDHILILSGRGDRHVQTIADAVVDAVLEARGLRPIGMEGLREGRWALIDYGDVVVHVFYHPLRSFYDIESLWHDAPRVTIDVPAELRYVGAEAAY